MYTDAFTLKFLLYANTFIYAYEIDSGTANMQVCDFWLPFNGQQQWIQGVQGAMAPLPSVKDYLSATLALNFFFFFLKILALLPLAYLSFFHVKLFSSLTLLDIHFFKWLVKNTLLSTFLSCLHTFIILEFSIYWHTSMKHIWDHFLVVNILTQEHLFPFVMNKHAEKQQHLFGWYDENKDLYAAKGRRMHVRASKT